MGDYFKEGINIGISTAVNIFQKRRIIPSKILTEAACKRISTQIPVKDIYAQMLLQQKLHKCL